MSDDPDEKVILLLLKIGILMEVEVLFPYNCSLLPDLSSKSDEMFKAPLISS